MNCVLLITGTIQPNTNYFVKKNDKNERLKEYERCLKYYICKSKIKRIVFCENSNYVFDTKPLIELAGKYNKQLEILQFQANADKVHARGKGFGEGEIIEYALNHSKLLKRSNYFIKVTGRLIVDNINQLIDKLQYPRTYFNVNLYLYNSIDTRLFCISTKQYKEKFLDLYLGVHDRRYIYIESIFLDAIRKNKIKIYNFPIYPHIIGCSGSSGIDYEEDVQNMQWALKIASKLNLFNLRYVYYMNYMLLNRFFHQRI